MATDAMGAFNLVVNDPSLTADEVAKQTSANMNRIADVIKKEFELPDNLEPVNILDFSQNIYDAAITVQFVGKLREQKKFSGVDALVKQLRADEITARKLLADKVK